jgi:hypothetical protein
MAASRLFAQIPWQAEVDDSDSENDDELEQKMMVKAETDITPSIPCVVLQHPINYAPPSLSVTLATLKHMFSKKNVWERAHVFTCGVLQLPVEAARTVQSHALYKGYRKLLYKLLRDEYNLIKRNIRLLQRRRSASNKPQRSRRPRPLSKYAVFCRELRASRPHEEIVGKIQQLWKLKKEELARQKREAMTGPRPSIFGLKRPFMSEKRRMYESDETDTDTSEDSEEEKEK